MTETVRVYVNSKGVEVAMGATMLDAVRASDPAMADLIAAGERALVDSRGLSLDPTAPAFMGAIVRVVSGRRRADGDGA